MIKIHTEYTEMRNTVWINGCFDVLHYGHFKLIEYAATLGQVMIGIDSDQRVKQLKGNDRPFHTQQQRMYNLRQIKNVFDVTVFNTEEELSHIIKTLQPDILVIGSDYKNKKIIGSEFVNEIRFFNRLENFSTTKLLYE